MYRVSLQCCKNMPRSPLVQVQKAIYPHLLEKLDEYGAIPEFYIYSRGSRVSASIERYKHLHLNYM